MIALRLLFGSLFRSAEPTFVDREERCENETRRGQAVERSAEREPTTFVHDRRSDRRDRTAVGQSRARAMMFRHN